MMRNPLLLNVPDEGDRVVLISGHPVVDKPPIWEWGYWGADTFNIEQQLSVCHVQLLLDKEVESHVMRASEEIIAVVFIIPLLIETKHVKPILIQAKLVVSISVIATIKE